MTRQIIAEQARENVLKVSDLIEVAGSRPDLARWNVSGVIYEYHKGARQVKVRPVRSSTTYCLDLDTPSKAAAKRAVLEDLRT
ncbi:hypothetical protein [Pseudomonas aeruginosa]|uniref:hypothetical protein n=1 Tax=Pseudomonas aeruginosa TaxID=287 RepID=UPI0034E0CC24